MKGKSYKSEIMAAVHEAATSLHEAGVMDKKTMRSFDEVYLTKVEPMTPEYIRALREANHVIQSIFAHYSISQVVTGRANRQKGAMSTSSDI